MASQIRRGRKVKTQVQYIL